MTSHAIATTVRSASLTSLQEELFPALDVMSPEGDRRLRHGDLTDRGCGPVQDVGEDFMMYLQLRATSGTVTKCLTYLERHMAAHPGADTEIVGIGADPRTVRVIIGVNLGDSYKIKSRPSNVLAAYDFVQSLFTNLAHFWPQYLTGVPTEDERDLLASVVAAGTITARTAAPHAPARTFEPEQEFVLDGADGIWQVEVAVV